MNLVFNLAFGLLLLAAALASLTMAAQLVANKPMVGAALCLAPATWIYGGLGDIAATEVAGLSFYASDLIAGVLIIAALIQFDAFGDWAWPLAGITFLIGLSLVQGVALFGAAAAVNDARSSIYLVAAVWWAVTVDWSKQDVGRAALVAGWLFVALAFLHLFLYGFATVNGTGDESSVDASYRMLNSSQALVLALCTATVIFDRNRRRLASAVIFMVVLIAAQNRSVWVALIGGFMAVALLSADSDRRRAALTPLALGGLVVALVLAGTLGGSIGSKLTTAGTDTVTWAWRVQGWEILLDSWLSGPLAGILLGVPFGSGLERVVDGLTWTVGAHSWYVELLLKVGAIGMLLWITLIVRGIARARKTDVAALFYGAALLCFSVAYDLPQYVAPWLGVLLTVQGSARVSRVSNGCRPVQLAQRGVSRPRPFVP